MKDINSETDFEKHLRKDIVSFSIPNDYILFNSKKAVDILIAKNGDIPRLFFIEVKYHKNSHGRMGIGQGKGGGFQPEILQTKTDYFEQNLIWILGNEDSEEYWLCNNETIRKYVNNGFIGEKYNGIQLKIFKEENSISKETIIKKLENWFLL